MTDTTTTLAAWRSDAEPLTAQRLQFARDLGAPDWSLSVPETAKAVIRDLLPAAEAMPRLLAFAEAMLALTDDVGNESTGPTFVACYEVRAALAEHLGGEGL